MSKLIYRNKETGKIVSAFLLSDRDPAEYVFHSMKNGKEFGRSFSRSKEIFESTYILES